MTHYALQGFNSATALKPWMIGSDGTKRPTGESFNSATALKPWMMLCLSVGVQWRRSFNSATALKPWMISTLVTLLGTIAVLQFGHGVEAVDDTSWSNVAAFSYRLQFGHGVEAVDDVAVRVERSRPASGFNSATALKPWMTSDRGTPDNKGESLQFGHGVEAVDDPTWNGC